MAIGEATRSDEGHLQGLSRTRQENEVCDVGFTDVAAYIREGGGVSQAARHTSWQVVWHSPSTLETVNTQKVHPQLDGTLGVADGRALVQHDAPGLFELRDNGARAVACRLDDPDALVDDGLGIGAVVWGVERGQKGDVHAEGVFGQGAALLDLLTEVLGRGEDEGGDDAQATGVGDGGGEFGVADILDDGGGRGQRCQI